MGKERGLGEALFFFSPPICYMMVTASMKSFLQFKDLDF